MRTRVYFLFLTCLLELFCAVDTTTLRDFFAPVVVAASAVAELVELFNRIVVQIVVGKVQPRVHVRRQRVSSTGGLAKTTIISSSITASVLS